MITNKGHKTIYNTDNKKAANKWVREEIKGMKTYDAPQLSSALKVKQKGRGRSVEGHIGYFGSNGNSIYDNETLVYIQSEASSRANGLSIVPENFYKITTLFTARRAITSEHHTWVNDKDEYLAPNTGVDNSKEKS